MLKQRRIRRSNRTTNCSPFNPGLRKFIIRQLHTSSLHCPRVTAFVVAGMSGGQHGVNVPQEAEKLLGRVRNSRVSADEETGARKPGHPLLPVTMAQLVRRVGAN